MRDLKGWAVGRVAAVVLTGTLFAGTVMAGCAKLLPADNGTMNSELQLSDTTKVTLRVAGDTEDFKALEMLAQRFHEKHPNCTVEYEYIQNYEENLTKRLATEEEAVDLFVTDNIQKDAKTLDYAMELNSQGDKLNLSDAYDGMIKNFTLNGTDRLYAVPMTSELRGLYVNKTLLKKYGIDVPQNRQELLDACAKLKEEGYIPLQGNPGNFGQQLIYPYIANMIVNSDDYEATWNMINTCEDGCADYFEDPLSFMYELMQNGYYDYKTQENTYQGFLTMEAECVAQSFLGVYDQGDGTKQIYEDGIVPFMPGPVSLGTQMERIKQDYHSDIDYEFMLAPVSDEGGYAYISPGRGIAINKYTNHADWALAFLNYMFEEDNNKQFAKDYDSIPNTDDVVTYVSNKFDIPQDRICQLGDVTFDYGFYDTIVDTIVAISKGNNPKYMQDNGDGTYSLYDFWYYMSGLRDAFTVQKGEVAAK